MPYILGFLALLRKTEQARSSLFFRDKNDFGCELDVNVDNNLEMLKKL